MYDFLKELIIFVVCKILFRVRYENIDILNKFDKCIIAPNHSRIYDPVFVYPKVSNIHIMAKSELFKNKFLDKFLTYLNVFPVDREHNDGKALRKALKVFKNNEKAKLLIFPEGKVLKTKEERGTVKNGAVFISMMSEVPIIPVYITARPRYFSKVLVKLWYSFS